METVIPETAIPVDAAALAKLVACGIGTVKQADCKYSDHALRTVINRIQLQSNNLLHGWINDDQFIYNNEQRPLEVFAHFLHKESNMLIVVNGLSELVSTENKEAQLAIQINTINCLHR